MPSRTNKLGQQEIYKALSHDQQITFFLLDQWGKFLEGIRFMLPACGSSHIMSANTQYDTYIN